MNEVKYPWRIKFESSSKAKENAYNNVKDLKKASLTLRKKMSKYGGVSGLYLDTLHVVLRLWFYIQVVVFKIIECF